MAGLQCLNIVNKPLNHFIDVKPMHR